MAFRKKSAFVLSDDGSKEEEEDDEDVRTLFCCNLHERVTEEILYETFLQAGPLDSVCIPKDKNGKQRCYGFVTYSHRCSPPYAIKLLTGLRLYGRKISIKMKCQPIDEEATCSSMPTDYQHNIGSHHNNLAQCNNHFPALRNPSPSTNTFGLNVPKWTTGATPVQQLDQRVFKNLSLRGAEQRRGKRRR